MRIEEGNFIVFPGKGKYQGRDSKIIGLWKVK
jgi:hypothetical protein